MTASRHSNGNSLAPVLTFAAWAAGWWFGALIMGLLDRPLGRLLSRNTSDAIAAGAEVAPFLLAVGLTVALATLRLRTAGSLMRQHLWQSSLLYLVTLAGIGLFFAAGGASSGHTSGVPLVFSLMALLGAGVNGVTLAIARRRLASPSAPMPKPIPRAHDSHR